MATPSLKEVYKGYQIVSVYGWTSGPRYSIYENGNMITQMSLSSVKACRNVIETYIKSLKKKNYEPRII